MTSKKDLYKLTSIDEHGHHLSIIPAEVTGYFRKNRTRVHIILLIVFLVLPWIHFNGQQLVLLNISSRDFIFFGMRFRSHDAPLAFLFLITFVLVLAFVTAVWGRIWCGWACPQTVFIETIYRKIEFWIEGGYLQRRKLRSSSWSLYKLKKFLQKWCVFFLVSSVIAHSFIAYFTGSLELLKMIQGSPAENWNYFLIVLFVTGLLLFNFAWFREQFCVIMCPYGRIQSVLLEPSSLAIVYDETRGEPRRGSNLEAKSTGDCVSCNRCVEACPTGIDIRNGLQMECIACTACVDACDEIMRKVKKPTRLISYKTLDNSPLTIFKVKTIFYSVIILMAMGVLVYSFQSREPLNIAVLRAIDSPYSVIKNDSGHPQILNHFRLHLTNQTSSNSIYKIILPKKESDQGLILTTAENSIVLKADESHTWHLFVSAPLSKLSPQGNLPFKILIQGVAGETFERDLLLIGPKK